MKKILFLCACLFLTLSVAGAADEALKIDVKEKFLANGMQVLVVKRTGAPEIVCRLFYKVGSVNEITGVTGVTHLVEHMMFKGTNVIGTKDPVKDAQYNRRIDELVLEIRRVSSEDPDSGRIKTLREELERVRGEQKAITVPQEIWRIYLENGATDMNAFTSNDHTGYVVTVPSNKLELFFWLESDRTMNPVFREFYSELDVIKEERRLGENRPLGNFHETFGAVMYDAHPYAHSVIGWMADLENLTLKKTAAYHDAYYVPNNAVLVLVGDVEPDNAFALAEKYFGRVKRGEDPPKMTSVEPQQRCEKRVYAELSVQPQVTIAYHAPTYGNPDRYALRVLSTILSGPAGRLHRVLVREKELATGVGCDYGMEKYAGSFGFDATAKGEHTPEELESAIYDVLDNLIANSVTDRELERAKKEIKTELVRGLASNGRLAHILASQSCVGDWREILVSPAKIAAVTKEDVVRVAKKYLIKTNRTVGIVKKSADSAHRTRRNAEKGE